MRVGNVDASKCVIGPMPLLPAVMFAQAVATSLPTGLMMPRPVTTTRRLLIFRTCLESQAGLIGPYGAVCLRTPKKQKLRLVAQLPVLSIGKNSSLDVSLDVVDRLLHRRDLLRFLVGDLALEFLFESHHQLDGIERIRAEVIHERRIRRDLVFLHAQL